MRFCVGPREETDDQETESEAAWVKGGRVG